MYFYEEAQIAYCFYRCQNIQNISKFGKGVNSSTNTVFDTVGITVEYINGIQQVFFVSGCECYLFDKVVYALDRIMRNTGIANSCLNEEENKGDDNKYLKYLWWG